MKATPKMSTKKLIEIKNIHIDYDMDDDNGEVIHNVSLDIYNNDFICLLGPSGCGKSTILKAIAGFIKPYKGTIEMNGKTIEGPDKSRGVVFQEANLFPWFTVRQNVAIGPKMAGLPQNEVDEICDKYLSQVELASHEDMKVFELSGGQKQRVSIARTLANHPEVILMDEPFGALDSFTRQKMQIMLRKLWTQNKSTIFFVTHDIDEALLLGTKIHVMGIGKEGILKSYNVNYTNELIKDSKKRVFEEKAFIQLREDILELLEN